MRTLRSNNSSAGHDQKVNNKKHSSFCVILPGAPEMDSTLWNGSDSRC